MSDHTSGTTVTIARVPLAERARQSTNQVQSSKEACGPAKRKPADQHELGIPKLQRGSNHRGIVQTKPKVAALDTDDVQEVRNKLQSHTQCARRRQRHLPVDLMIKIFSFVIGDSASWMSMLLVSKRWNRLCDNRALFANEKRLHKTANFVQQVNWKRFRNLGIQYRGTEGVLHHCVDRLTGQQLAYRKARVFPTGDGVP